MAVIKPFKALRPRSDLVDQVAALPYDVMNSQEAKEMVEGNNYSFLRIDRGEINFTEMPDPHEPQVYAKAREILDDMVKQGHFIQDEQDCLYIYRQIMDGRAQTGLVTCTSVDDYNNDVIKKHEFTRPDKEQDRIDHIKALHAQTGPIFQTYRDNAQVVRVINEWIDDHKPVYEFTAHNVEHICWVVDCPTTIQTLIDLFAKIDHLYIADGHHRSAAACRVGMEMRQENQDPGAEFNYFLSVVFPASDLKIWPYNRLVTDLNGYSEEEFVQKVKESFVLEEAPSSPFEPTERHSYGMYLGGTWYKLTPKPGIVDTDDIVKDLDVAVLQDHLLEPILNIQDPRRDARIDFVGGIRGVRELERRVQEGMKVAFSMYPTSIDEILDVADSNQVMPPKSTWFEPKLLSGLFIHKLS
ncbi:MAG: DUF1015 domain-containing protein [Firmicutes bacterium]|nr:DUF1015 domain-containing protein [Bacillota bacterium]